MRLRSLLLCLAVLASGPAAAAGGAFGLLHAKVDLEDYASLQRGAQVYVNYCLGCHALSYMRYQRMGEDLGIAPKDVQDNLLFTADKITERMSIAMAPDAAERWFGVAPPDLSVIARSRGADWLYSYLVTFYADPNPSRPFGVNNLVFPDVGMPHVLWSLQGTQKYVPAEVDGKVTESHIQRIEAVKDEILIHKLAHVEAAGGHGQHGGEQYLVDRLRVEQPGALSPGDFRGRVHDLVNFLTYASEPGKVARTSLGVWVLVFLVFLFALTRLLYKEYWKDIH